MLMVCASKFHQRDQWLPSPNMRLKQSYRSKVSKFVIKNHRPLIDRSSTTHRPLIDHYENRHRPHFLIEKSDRRSPPFFLLLKKCGRCAFY